MKKFFILLLMALSLVFFTSCEADMRAKFADLMGSMSGNVMGSDTSSVDNAVESSKVDEDSITEPVIENGKVTVAGNIEVDVADVEITSIIGSVSPEKKEAIVSSITDARKNSEATAKLQTEMAKKETDEKTIAAVEGTAKLYQMAIDKVLSDNSESIPDVVSDAVSQISAGLASIADSSSVTKADVVLVQMVQSFVQTVSDSIGDDNSSFAITEDLISEANQLVIVAETISPASSFNIDLGAIVSQLMSGMNGKDGNARALEDFTQEMELDADAAKYCRMAYQMIRPMIDANYDSFISALSFHKSTYETLVSLASSEAGDIGKKALSELASYEGLINYILASVITEADKMFEAVKFAEEYNGTLVSTLKDIMAGYEGIQTALKEFVSANDWLKDSSKPAILKYPESWNVEECAPDNNDEAFLRDHASGMISALNTFKVMTDYVSLDSFSGFDLKANIDEAIKWLEDGDEQK